MLTAIVLAAGQSRRMGLPKINLPWGDTTVLGQVLETLLRAEVDEILLVTGAHPVQGLADFLGRGVKAVHNPDYIAGEMLSSFQVGLQAASAESEAALFALGDQPQMELAVVKAVLDAYRLTRPPILIPSYHMRPGHPGLVGRVMWGEIMALRPPNTLREFLNAHAAEIHYLPVEAGTILQDLDTPQDYKKYQPK